MSQRNPMNERYNDENRGGKTRRSAASAKPSAARAATVREPAPKTKKQKKQEARERERKREQKYTVDVPDNKIVENTPEYKRLRRLWWICLGGAILCIGLSVAANFFEPINVLYLPCLIMGYALVIVAFYIDFGKIRKLRKQQQALYVEGKSKAARAAQKQARAEARAKQKEAEENSAAAQAGEEEKQQEGIGARIKKALPFGGDSNASSPAEEEAQPSK